jgi:tyrosyl-tRNA synthetase
MEAKKRLARTIASEFWGEEAALEAEERWREQFQERRLPAGDANDGAHIHHWAFRAGNTYMDVLRDVGIGRSNRERMRLFDQKAVEVGQGQPERVGQVLGPREQVIDGEAIKVGKLDWIFVREDGSTG